MLAFTWTESTPEGLVDLTFPVGGKSHETTGQLWIPLPEARIHGKGLYRASGNKVFFNYQDYFVAVFLNFPLKHFPGKFLTNQNLPAVSKLF